MSDCSTMTAFELAVGREIWVERFSLVPIALTAVPFVVVSYVAVPFVAVPYVVVLSFVVPSFVASSSIVRLVVESSFPIDFRTIGLSVVVMSLVAVSSAAWLLRGFLGCTADGLAVVMNMTMERSTVVELLDQVGASDAAQLTLYALPLLGFIPEEELPLRQLLTWCLGREDRFESIRVVTRIPRLGADGHRRGRKVLHLLKVEVQILGDDSKLCHILFLTARMAANKIRYDLLFQPLLFVDTVEDVLKLIELLK